MQAVVTPGAMEVTGQVMADKPTIGSDTAIAPSVTLPVLVTAKRYLSVSPLVTPPLPSASLFEPSDLARVSDDVCGTAVVDEPVAVTVVALGVLAAAVALLTMVPASTSAWVTT